MRHPIITIAILAAITIITELLVYRFSSKDNLKTNLKKAIWAESAFLILIVLIATIVISMTSKPSNSDSVWDEDMTMGNLDAKNYYIIYSDLACPYCIYFENPIVEHEEDFKKYLEENDILLEIRLSDFLYEYGVHPTLASRYGAEATYCAKNEGRFWDYYNLAVHTVWRDYFNGNAEGYVGLGKTDKNYWIKLGESIGLGDTFKSCVENDESLDLIIERAAKTTKLVSGMPYFKFNDYTFSGFDPNGGYDEVMMYMDAGLKKK